MPRPRYAATPKAPNRYQARYSGSLQPKALAEELGAGADAVPQQPDRPDELVRLAASHPLVGDQGGERERQHRAQEGEDDVQVHRREHLRQPLSSTWRLDE